MIRAATDPAKELRSFIERIERLTEDRKAFGDDIADLFKEMVAKGYDKDAAKAVLKIRASKTGVDGFIEKSGVLDAYLAALGMLPGEAPAPAPARAHGNIEQFAASFPAHDAETGELEDQPETANEMHQRPSINDEPSPEAGPQAEASHCQDTGVGTLAGHEGRREGEAASADLPTNSNSAAPVLPSAPKADDVSSPASSATPSDEDVPAFLKRDVPRRPAADFRPNCQHPDACAASGLRHCHSCAKIEVAA